MVMAVKARRRVAGGVSGNLKLDCKIAGVKVAL
jgi:hypothetical protein